MNHRALIGAALLTATAAAASDPAPERIRLGIGPCSGINRRQVERLLGIELQAEVLGAGAPAADALEASVSCGEDGLRLAVENPATGLSADRRIALEASRSPGAERLVALALSELAAATRAPKPPGAPPAPVASPSGALGISVLGGARLFPGHAPVVWGGGMELSGALPLGLGWASGLALERGRGAYPSGRITATLASASLVATASAQLRWLHLEGGLGGRLGWAELSGRSQVPGVEGRRVAGVWMGPCAVGRARVGERLAGELRLEVGAATQAVVGTEAGRDLFAVRGLWVGLNAGVVWRP